MSNTSEGGPKRNESDVYDRQIRLWGAEAQAKMGQAKVLYIHITGVSSEILKNMVLAGIRATLCDMRPLDQALTTPSFFYNAEREHRKRQKVGGGEDDDQQSEQNEVTTTVADVVKPVIEELNPLLDSCDIVTKSVDELTKDDVQAYQVVVASRISMQQACQLSQWVVESGGVFYHVDTFGLYGACAMDLGRNFRFRPEKGKELLDETLLKPHIPLSQMYQVPFSDATNRFHKAGPPAAYLLWRCILEYQQREGQWPCSENASDFASKAREWIQETSPSFLLDDSKGDRPVLSEASLQQIAQVATAEIAPVCAVLGGLVGNEIIKAISGKGEPANNTLLFEGITCKAFTFLIQPK